MFRKPKCRLVRDNPKDSNQSFQVFVTRVHGDGSETPVNNFKAARKRLVNFLEKEVRLTNNEYYGLVNLKENEQRIGGDPDGPIIRFYMTERGIKRYEEVGSPETFEITWQGRINIVLSAITTLVVVLSYLYYESQAISELTNRVSSLEERMEEFEAE